MNTAKEARDKNRTKQTKKQKHSRGKNTNNFQTFIFQGHLK